MPRVNLAHLRAQEKFREVLSGTGNDPPVLERIDSQHNMLEYRLIFRGLFVFRGHPSLVGSTRLVDWYIDRQDMQDFCPGRSHSGINSYINEFRHLYSRMYEDHLMEMQLAPRRQLLDELVMRTTDPRLIHAAMAQYQEFERHVRNHHSGGRYTTIGGLPVVADDSLPSGAWYVNPSENHLDRPRSRPQTATYSSTLQVESLPNEGPSQDLVDSMRVMMESQTYQAFIGNQSQPYSNSNTIENTSALTYESLRGLQQQMQREQDRILQQQWNTYVQASQQFMGDFAAVGNPQAEAKGLELLKSWLTPDQASQYEEHKYFEVVGSDTKKRYRIRHGRQMNIDELDAKGNKVRGLCALPSGGVVAADCMLAQKLALETDEKHFLSVANVFDDRTRQPMRSAINGMRMDMVFLDDISGA